MTNYVERDITPTILEALKEMPVVVLTGMRQTGKSTFLESQREFGERKYVTFDDFGQLTAAKQNPEGFVAQNIPLSIDEAQKCPEVLTAIKNSVGRKRQPGQFLLSGSANFSMLKSIAESLAGRAIYFTLHPLTRRELTRRIKEKPFLRNCLESGLPPKSVPLPVLTDEEILQGGMPSVALHEVKNRFLWFKGYEQTYLERDLRELSRISNLISFRNLLHLVALRSGQLLVPIRISRDAKLNAPTTTRYLSLLETSYIIHRLIPYLRNRASRLIKSPKIYMSDSGLGCYLTGQENLDADPLRGAYYETYVTQNILGILAARWPAARLHFWHIQGRTEVDFIIEAGNACLALEIKASSRWTERDLTGLKSFLSFTPHCRMGILAYNGKEPVKLGDRLWAIPLSAVLS